MSEEKKKRPPLDRDQLMAKALKLLGQRDYAQAELQDRLNRRAASAEDVAWVLAQLQSANFVNDVYVAERRAVTGKEQRLVGRRRVAQEMAAQRLDPEAIEQGLSAAYDDVDEDQLALRFLREKLSPFLLDNKLEDAKQLQRAYGRLRRAGFPHASTIRALRQHSELAGSFDEMAGDDEFEGQG